MNVALFAIAVASHVGNPLAIPVKELVPVIDIQRSCKETAAATKAVDLDLSQSVANCVRDEDAARVQLMGIWPTYSAAVRDQCVQEATIPGTPSSYVDLLTCLQMNDPARMSPAPELKGAGRTKNRE